MQDFLSFSFLCCNVDACSEFAYLFAVHPSAYSHPEQITQASTAASSFVPKTKLAEPASCVIVSLLLLCSQVSVDVCWVCSYKKLPFEAHQACWNAIPEADARALIQSLLKTKPQERATATALLASPLLAGMELLSTE